MGTKIRPKISKRNRWWISRERHLELHYFCLQYGEWKKAYAELEQYGVGATPFLFETRHTEPSDPTAKLAVAKAELVRKIRMVEGTAYAADPELAPYILKAVTEDLSFPVLKSKHGIPCERDMYYDRFRKFFWLLNHARE